MMLTTAQVAVALGVRETTLRNWRVRNQGPPYVRVRGAVRYRREDIEAYIQENRVEPGKENPK